MFQKDYILRMIEAIGLMVARIKTLIAGGDAQGVQRELQLAAAQTGIDLAIGRTLDGESLLSIFMPPGSSVDPTNCMLFGEIMYLDGLSHYSSGDSQLGYQSLAKALLLLQAASGHATSAGIRYPEVDARIDEIRGLLDDA